MNFLFKYFQYKYIMLPIFFIEISSIEEIFLFSKEVLVCIAIEFLGFNVISVNSDGLLEPVLSEFSSFKFTVQENVNGLEHVVFGGCGVLLFHSC